MFIGKGAAEPEIDLALLPGDPTPLLTPSLARLLNPVVVLPQKAKRLPDAPATRSALDHKCRPVKMRVAWQPNVSPEP